MNRHLVIAGSLVCFALLVLWGVAPGTWTGTGEVAGETPGPEEPSSVEKRVERFEPALEPEPAPAPASAGPVPTDPRWSNLHGRFRKVMDGRIEVVVPDGATEYEANELQLDAIDARSTELDDLIVELTELAESTTDPPTRVDALVSLGEVYLELVENLESTPIPEWMKARRARRLEADLAERSAIALDKARMVLEMARGSGGEELGAEMSHRIREGLEAVQ